MIEPGELPTSEVDKLVFRAIPARHPPTHLFERVSSPQDWDVLHAVESLTNPRLREEAGDIRLVAPEDRVCGAGAAWVMAAYTHPPVDGRGGRFNKDFGVYYCCSEEMVAIAESTFGLARFLRESRISETMQEICVVRARLGPVSLHDVRQLESDALYRPDDYAESQRLGALLRNLGSHGIHYRSVRADGECIGVMRPGSLSEATQCRWMRCYFEQSALSRIEFLDGKTGVKNAIYHCKPRRMAGGAQNVAERGKGINPPAG